MELDESILRRPKEKKKESLEKEIFLDSFSQPVVRESQPRAEYTALAKRNFIGRDTRQQVTMPPVRRVERKGGFLVADGRNNAATKKEALILGERSIDPPRQSEGEVHQLPPRQRGGGG